MSNANERVRVKVGDGQLVLYRNVTKLERIPGTDLHIDLEGTTVRELAEAAGLEGAYDYALPQTWFDEYLAKWGRRPVGVWWYPRKSDGEDGAYWLAGRFVGVPELLERIGRRILAQEGVE
jgi:hypothetical protein